MSIVGENLNVTMKKLSENKALRSINLGRFLKNKKIRKLFIKKNVKDFQKT
jgi:hypothetical protein